MLTRLSTAQKRALLGIPCHREFIPEHTGFQWPTLARPKQLRLINSVLSGIPGKGKSARHVITQRGLKLREELAIAMAPDREANGDLPGPKPCQARAEGIAQNKSDNSREMIG